jgi:hypothetical protein
MKNGIDKIASTQPPQPNRINNNQPAETTQPHQQKDITIHP